MGNYSVSIYIADHGSADENRCCNRACRVSQGRKVCRHWWSVSLCAHRGRGHYEHVSTLTLPIWEERSPQPQATRGKKLFCSREFRCQCNASMLSCYMTACRSLTARNDDLYPILPISIFKLPREHIYRELYK